MRRIVILAFDRVQTLDITGPSEVFSLATRARPTADTYSIELLTTGGAVVQTSSGLTLQPHGPLDTREIDTLVVPGGQGTRAAARDERLISWIRTAARRSRRVTSVCTGAFLLARAGLLDGRRATTHWAACKALQTLHPSIDVDPDPIFIRDGNVYTSAGVTAGIDLALALIEEDLGPQAALNVARSLVLFVRRPGGQAQFSAGLKSQAASQRRIRELQQWIQGHLTDDLTVPALADRSHMSERNLSRVFAKEVGETPAAYVESLRIERARMLLETTEHQLERIAGECGFGTVETLRRTFARRLHASPGDYRTRFNNVTPINRRAAS
ncbi:MAG TPA: GlxA family transcriptional regulator [Solirubrobacteraceae bacterium]|nr:GlxA family transcriptional regulator [Solirubrobacteraceae bacterium]